MAFVAFGKKKVINDQQLQQSFSRTNKNLATKISYEQSQQQQIIDTSIGQSIAHSDLEGFRLANAEVDADMVFKDGHERDVFIKTYESPTNTQKEQIMQTTKAEEISHLLEHNDALRQNFDNLKQLHLQLAEANAQLQEALLSMQDEKIRMEDGLIHHSAIHHKNEKLKIQMEEKTKYAKELDIFKAEHEKIYGLAVELEQRNMSLETKMALMKGDNKELNHKLEVVRYGHDDISESQLSSIQMSRLEKDQALHNKYVVELDYARELSLVKMENQTYRQQATNLAHKCKHLEIDLDKAILAREAVHQQLVALNYKKDATIMNLDQALQKLRDDLEGLEQQQNDMERSWQVERHKLQALLDEKERDEHKLKLTIQQEVEQKVKESYDEIVKLRTLLNALEKSSANIETQHLEALKETKKVMTQLLDEYDREVLECDILHKELMTTLVTQKETSYRLMDMERLRVQLEDALTQNHELVSQIAQYRKARDDLDRKIERMRLELADAVATRRKEQVEHAIMLEKIQRKCAEEKSVALKQEDKLLKASKKEFCCKYRALKKRSKHTSKLLATMTVNHNKLIIRLRECETQLAIAQTTRFHGVVDNAPSTSKSFLKLETFNSGLFKAEMKELEDRQAKFLDQSIEHIN